MTAAVKYTWECFTGTSWSSLTDYKVTEKEAREMNQYLRESQKKGTCRNVRTWKCIGGVPVQEILLKTEKPSPPTEAWCYTWTGEEAGCWENKVTCMTEKDEAVAFWKKLKEGYKNGTVGYPKAYHFLDGKLISTHETLYLDLKPELQLKIEKQAKELFKAKLGDLSIFFQAEPAAEPEPAAQPTPAAQPVTEPCVNKRNPFLDKLEQIKHITNSMCLDDEDPLPLTVGDWKKKQEKARIDRFVKHCFNTLPDDIIMPSSMLEIETFEAFREEFIKINPTGVIVGDGSKSEGKMEDVE